MSDSIELVSSVPTFSDSIELVSSVPTSSAPYNGHYDLYSPFQYQWSCINFFLAIWLLSSLIRQALLRMKYLDINNNFGGLDEGKKRNVVTYIMQVLVTSLAFILQIYGSLDILFRNEDSTSQTRFQYMVLSIQAIAVLYVWELCYRVNIGWPLLVHHVVTVMLIQLSTASSFDTNDSVEIRLAILLGFNATTEQVSFVALFFFRLRLYPAWHGILFYAAAAQAFILKTIVSGAAVGYAIIVFYVDGDLDADVTNWKWFWKICFLPFVIVLYASQLYACKILFELGSRCQKAPTSLGVSACATGECVEDVNEEQNEWAAKSRWIRSTSMMAGDLKELEMEAGRHSAAEQLDTTELFLVEDDGYDDSVESDC
jgi:hypothetical protein